MEENEKTEYKKSTIIRPGADMKKTTKESHYVDNVAFYEALVKRKSDIEHAIANDLPPPRVNDFVGKCLMDIANNLSMKHYFRNYPFRENMVGEAIVHMLRNIDGFNIAITKNPFSYFTQTAYYSFIDTIKSEKRELATKFKATMQKIAVQDVSDHDEDYNTLIAEENMPDVGYMSDYLRDFEISLEKKKKASKKKADEGKVDIANLGDSE